MASFVKAGVHRSKYGTWCDECKEPIEKGDIYWGEMEWDTTLGRPVYTTKKHLLCCLSKEQQDPGFLAALTAEIGKRKKP